MRKGTNLDQYLVNFPIKHLARLNLQHDSNVKRIIPSLQYLYQTHDILLYPTKRYFAFIPKTFFHNVIKK